MEVGRQALEFLLSSAHSEPWFNAAVPEWGVLTLCVAGVLLCVCVKGYGWLLNFSLCLLLVVLSTLHDLHSTWLLLYGFWIC